MYNQRTDERRIYIKQQEWGVWEGGKKPMLHLQGGVDNHPGSDNIPR